MWPSLDFICPCGGLLATSHPAWATVAFMIRLFVWAGRKRHDSFPQRTFFPWGGVSVRTSASEDLCGICSEDLCDAAAAAPAVTRIPRPAVSRVSMRNVVSLLRPSLEHLRAQKVRAHPHYTNDLCKPNMLWPALDFVAHVAAWMATSHPAWATVAFTRLSRR